jgi:long-chain acyl-CoA synthetase
VTGAAPVSKEILEFFSGLDVVISEVYGQSEDCGPTTFNAPGRTRFGSVGPEFPGVTVKLAEDDEIMVQGRNVFMGYLHDESATKEALTDDGWLLTGDLGKFDDDGFLHITGRKKDIIITAGGKNIAPKNIELALTNDALVSQAVVIGDRRKFLSAVLTLDPEAAVKFAKEHNLSGDALHNDPVVIAAIQAVVDTVNPMFARVDHIRKFTLLSRELSVEDGELTPSLKIKRNKVNAHFEAEIEAMYAD